MTLEVILKEFDEKYGEISLYSVEQHAGIKDLLRQAYEAGEKEGIEKLVFALGITEGSMIPVHDLRCEWPQKVLKAAKSLTPKP